MGEDCHKLALNHCGFWAGRKIANLEHLLHELVDPRWCKNVKMSDHVIQLPTTLQLDKILVHFDAHWCSGSSRMQGLAVNLMWFCVECHVVLRLDHNNIGMQCKCNVFGLDKFCSVAAVVATKGCAGLTVALFCGAAGVALRPVQDRCADPGHSIANDFALCTDLLCGEGECD